MDRHVDPFNKGFTAWLKPWSEVVDFGLHPTYALGSWESPRRWEVLADEIKRFEELLNQPCHHIRMHYLRCKPHVDYPKFSSLGIQNDWSMGYGNRPGFRSGVSRPYRFLKKKNPLTNSCKFTLYRLWIDLCSSHGFQRFGGLEAKMGAYLTHAENHAYPLVFNLHNNLVADHNEYWAAFTKSLENV